MRISAFDNFPPIKGVRWFNVFVFLFTPAAGIAGFWLAPHSHKTAAWAFLYYVFSMLGIHGFPTGVCE